jgi:glycerophosphoryl diester phosphodiesterase
VFSQNRIDIGRRMKNRRRGGIRCAPLKLLATNYGECTHYSVHPLGKLEKLYYSDNMSITIPAIIAHRGASHDAPENTLTAFNLAWRQGADGIEGDFRLTGDGRIVCTHDEIVRGAGGRVLTVAESTLARLRALDTASGRGPDETIPTLAEVLATVPDNKRIFIEIKCGPEIIAPLKEALTGAGRQPEQTMVLSFNREVVAESKRQLPRLKAFWLAVRSKKGGTNDRHPSRQEILSTLRQIKADGFSSNVVTLREDLLVRDLRRAHMELHVWTVDDPAMARYFQALGIDSLTTNRPGWLRRQLLVPVP